MSRLRHVGHPDFDTRLAENAQVLLAPASDEQRVRRVGVCEGRETDQQARGEDHMEACRTRHSDYLLRILGVVKILRGRALTVRGEARDLLRGRRLEAYLFAATLKHLNGDNCLPSNEELGRGRLPIDLLHTNGNRTELLNRVGPEPEPHAHLLDNDSLYRPPAGLVRGRGADYEPCVVVVKPDGNFP